MEVDCSISANQTASEKPEAASLSHLQSKLHSDLFSFETDDIFNLNSFTKEEYLVSTKSKQSRSQSKERRRSRLRHRRRSSSSSSRSKQKENSDSSRSRSRSSRTSSGSRTRSSSSRSSSSSTTTSTSSSSRPSRSRSRSRSSSSLKRNSSNSSNPCHSRLKSKVVLVNTNSNIQIDKDENSNDENEWKNYADQYARPKLPFSRMICTPPLPAPALDSEPKVISPGKINTQLNKYWSSLSNKSSVVAQEQALVDNALSHHSYRNPSDRSYCTIPVPKNVPPLPPFQFVQKNIQSTEHLSHFQHQFRPISPPTPQPPPPSHSLTDTTHVNKRSPLNQYQESMTKY